MQVRNAELTGFNVGGRIQRLREVGNVTRRIQKTL